MKKELLNFVNDDKDESRFRLNAISYLKHYTKNAFGKKIDRITIEFDQIFGHYCSISNNEIISRDFEGILTECQEKTEEFLSEVSRILCRELKAGHNGYERLADIIFRLRYLIIQLFSSHNLYCNHIHKHIRKG